MNGWQSKQGRIPASLQSKVSRGQVQAARSAPGARDAGGVVRRRTLRALQLETDTEDRRSTILPHGGFAWGRGEITRGGRFFFNVIAALRYRTAVERKPWRTRCIYRWSRVPQVEVIRGTEGRQVLLAAGRLPGSVDLRPVTIPHRNAIEATQRCHLRLARGKTNPHPLSGLAAQSMAGQPVWESRALGPAESYKYRSNDLTQPKNQQRSKQTFTGTRNDIRADEKGGD